MTHAQPAPGAVDSRAIDVLAGDVRAVEVLAGDVRGAGAQMRSVALGTCLAVALAVVGGCRGTKHPNAADNAIVYVKSNVRDAQVYLDGHFIAPLVGMRGGMAMVPGAHRIELRHEDYFSTYLEVRVDRRERKTVDLPLAAILP